MPYDLRCPECGRFIENDADGYYDQAFAGEETGTVACFCNKKCADKFHGRDVDVCPRCKLPAHATESTSEGFHPDCVTRPAEEPVGNAHPDEWEVA